MMTAGELAVLARTNNCVTGVLQELQRGAVRSFRDAHELCGNLVTRPFFLKAGEALERHKHGYDHITVIFTGVAAVCLIAPDGVRHDATVYAAGSEIEVLAGVWHDVVALFEDVEAKCYWARRINRVCPACGEEYLETGHSGGELCRNEMENSC